MQLQLWTDTNWTLIVSILAGSAVLAYLGDVLGLKYGKQRISLFGLRPKYTSRLITALTGIFISVAVLTVLSFFSQNVRTALFTMKALRTELNSLYVQLQNSRAESEETQNKLMQSRLALAGSRRLLEEQQILLQTTALSLDMARFDLETLRNDRDLLFSEKSDLEAAVGALREESEELRRELDMMRLEAIAVQANALLAQRAVPPGSSRERVSEILNALGEDARAAAAERRAEKNAPPGAGLSGIKLSFDPAEESAVASRVTDAPERRYIRALAAENIATGEEVRVRLESGASYLLYDKGETIHRRLADPREAGFNAEETLHVFLRELKNVAIKNGVKPDPATNSVGSLEGEDFFETVETLKSLEEPVIVSAVALEDIYTEGPVRIKIMLE
ncbi:MAG: DUF3084 domain-containing protein [Synergistaceae bacterium]|nr:DUF3084 domain-containing protein [Synergistaceae bacterium]